MILNVHWFWSEWGLMLTLWAHLIRKFLLSPSDACEHCQFQFLVEDCELGGSFFEIRHHFLPSSDARPELSNQG
jgi:hypothetical protein